jgi:cobalt-zinc-cadmium efflux system outer membrane protein
MRSSLAAICACLGALAAAWAQANEPTLLLPAAEYVAQRLPEVLPPVEPEVAGLRLEDVEQLALTVNPALAEAAARIRAARGQQYQVGLPPNPEFGYSASEIGNDGRAGQEGLIVGQEFVRGNKLGLNREVEAREVLRLEQHFAAQQQRVLTDVRIAFYNAYLAERRVDLGRSLQMVGGQLVATAGALLQAQEGRRTDLLQAEIESQRANMDLAQAESIHRGAWRRLAAAAGKPDMPTQALIADVDALDWSLGWDETLTRLLGESPEVSAAIVEIDKARMAVTRARVEPIPNVTAQLLAQYDAATNTTIAGAQVTVPLPLWNRNQGGVAKAQGDLAAASRRLDMVELRLQRDLAAEYQHYETALARTSTIRQEILGRAQQTLDSARQAYSAGELNFLDFLTVQRTYFQANLEYLTALGELCQSVETIRGLLLVGSYDHVEVPTAP